MKCAPASSMDSEKITLNSLFGTDRNQMNNENILTENLIFLSPLAGRISTGGKPDLVRGP